MIIFISGLLMSLVLYKLGSYTTIVYLYALGTKVLMVLLLATALALLSRKLWGMYRSGRLPHRKF